MTTDDSQDVENSGRRLLLALGGFVILLGGVLGFIVGANGGGDIMSELSVFGLLTVPLTPGAMTLYGMVVVTVAIVTLYTAVELASRYDTDAP
ncbi:hypothetical protein EGH24_12955 [Halonotius terrestris]|jgi:hypothetical protein|uniref:Cox cluster protein n=1 Tax=Halonotius terrestris TaxID=2487750 RepID=A0A8J8P7I9_9EURY|nr:hypothetical protein [Halonotius terrestris]TQQ78747.1 hypothetical protein EGH24_12955 [Halonotius terrestris]